jgi:hypothetical protein
MRLKSSSGGEKGSYGERLETVLDSFHYTGISLSPVELIWVFNGLELTQDTTKSTMLYNIISGVERFPIHSMLYPIIFLS